MDDNFVWKNRNELDVIISSNITKKCIIYMICALIEKECSEYCDDKYFDDDDKILLSRIIKFTYVDSMNSNIDNKNISAQMLLIGYDFSVIETNKQKWYMIYLFMDEIYVVTYYNNGYIYELYSDNNKIYINIQNNCGKLNNNMCNIL